VELKRRGKRAILFFLITREGSLRMRPSEVDPEYARLLRGAVKEGLEVMVYGIHLSREGIRLGERGALE
jgi:sugar fermentation stimulation protein A